MDGVGGLAAWTPQLRGHSCVDRSRWSRPAQRGAGRQFYANPGRHIDVGRVEVCAGQGAQRGEGRPIVFSPDAVFVWTLSWLYESLDLRGR